MKIKNSLTMDGSFETVENIDNSTFLKTQMKVFALGQNANGSAFSVDSFASAKKSMSLIPVVAKYTEAPDIYGNEGDLTGHNVTLREKDDGYDLFHDTYPIGVISNTSNITIEEVNEGTEENPDIKQYIVADEVYLWKRYDATKKIEEWIKQGITPKVSMEIGSVTGEFNEDNYFQIESFEFEAVAALGSDVTPCFPRAEITAYSKQEFKQELKELVFELNKTLENEQEKGGNENMAKKDNKEAPETIQTDYEKKDVELETPVAEAKEGTVAADNAVVEEDFVESEEAKVDAKEVDTDTSPDTQEELSDAPDKSDVEQSKDTPEDTPDNSSATVENVNVEDVVVESEVEQESDFEAKYNKLNESFTTLTDDHKVLKTELTELQSYKRQREEDDIKAKFAGKLSDEEFSQVFTELKDENLEKVEEKLFALIGKKNFAALSVEAKSDVNKIPVNKRKEEEPNSPFDVLFEAYLEK